MIATEILALVLIVGALAVLARLYVGYQERKDALDRKRDLEIAQIQEDSKAERAAIRANARIQGRIAEAQVLSEIPTSQDQDPIQAIMDFVIKNPQALQQITALLKGGQAPQGSTFPPTFPPQNPGLGDKEQS